MGEIKRSEPLVRSRCNSAVGREPATLALRRLAAVAAALALGGCLGSDEDTGEREAPAAAQAGETGCDRRVGSRVTVPSRSGTIPIGGFANLVEFSEGRLWVPVAPPRESEPGGVQLLRIAVPEGGVRRYAVRASGEVRIRVAGGTAWLADPQTGVVTRLDVDSGRRVRTRPFGDGQAPRELDADRDGVWVLAETGGMVAELSPATGRVLRRVRLDAAELGDVALARGSAWFSTTDGRLLRVSRRSGRVEGSVKVGDTALDVEVGEGQVWADLGDADRLAHVDDRSMRLVGHAANGGGVFAIAIGHGSVWATNYGPDTVTRLDAATGERIGAPLPTGPDPKGIATGAGSVWVADAGECTVMRIAP
jgi:streptogramin lyase